MFIDLTLFTPTVLWFSEIHDLSPYTAMLRLRRILSALFYIETYLPITEKEFFLYEAGKNDFGSRLYDQ